MHPAKCADAGIFGLGNPVADQEARRFIHKRYPGRSEDVVVSGSGVQAFTAVEQLLSMGIAPARITVVVPEEEGKVAGIPEKKVSCASKVLYFSQSLFPWSNSSISFADDTDFPVDH